MPLAMTMAPMRFDLQLFMACRPSGIAIELSNCVVAKAQFSLASANP
jgi:hypothetical protein